MAIEDPHHLGRLKLGREEYCQRLLTMLILDDAYPRWNTPLMASPAGLRFLGLLEELSLGVAGTWTDPVFVDELDLPKRTEWEQGGAPDQSLRDQSRLWMIELKTEAGSHRPTQIPLYFELGRHHYPRHRIDITYLTGPLSKGAPPIPDGCRFGHVTWSEVMPLVRDVWSDHSPTHRDVVRALDDVLNGLSAKWPAWRTDRLEAGQRVEQPPPDPAGDALDFARRTAVDHQQRALDFAPANLEDLQALRLELLGRIKGSGDAALLHVRPWLWRWASEGQPLTSAGRETGYELRLSWYKRPATLTGAVLAQRKS
jgi:hypothetical protein